MNRIERISRIIDYCLVKIFDKNTRHDSHIGWYNYFSDLLDKELDKDLKINPDELNVSPFMLTTIKKYITQTNFKYKYGFGRGGNGRSKQY